MMGGRKWRTTYFFSPSGRLHETKKGGAMTTAPAGESQEILVVKDAEKLNPLGQFFRTMLMNLLKEPGKVRIAEKLNLVVAIDPTESKDNSLTITFSKGHVVLQDGIMPNPDIKIKCELAVLMKLARVPAGPAAIKFLWTSDGKDLIAKVRSGELKIKGIIRHPLGMMKFSKFLAPKSS
jgi:hypothetical protein